jgi:hypothetical protein
VVVGSGSKRVTVDSDIGVAEKDQHDGFDDSELSVCGHELKSVGNLRKVVSCFKSFAIRMEEEGIDEIKEYGVIVIV